MTDDQLGEAVSKLYEAALSEFTAARNSLAAGLKAAGDEAAAKRVRGLRKPKISAWAINQLARRFRTEVQVLVDATEKVAGADDAISMRAAAAERQAALTRLSDLATTVLTQGGHSASAGTLQEIVQTLQASSDPEVGETLLRGQLSEPIAPTGFAFGHLAAVDEEVALEPSRLETQRLAESIARLEKELEKARALAYERRALADRARSRSETAEAEAIEAHETVERLEAELVELRGDKA
jgi:hypothetical protein